MAHSKDGPCPSQVAERQVQNAAVSPRVLYVVQESKRWSNSFMLRKLYAIVSGSCCPDNPDSPQHQEVLLPGNLYAMIIKERMEEILNNIRNNIAADVRSGTPIDFNDSKIFPIRRQPVNN